MTQFNRRHKTDLALLVRRHAVVLKTLSKMANTNLSNTQRAHVAKVFPECRSDMARYLAEKAVVDVCLQRAVGDAPPFAIYVCSDPDFWIDCCESENEAWARAKALGLTLSPH